MYEICDQPEIFSHIDEAFDFIFIRGYDNDGTYGYMALDFRAPKMCIVHLEMTRFTAGVLKSLKGDWANIVARLKKDGIKHLATQRLGVLADYGPWLKFIRHFGFTDVQQIVSSVQNI